MTTIFPDVGLYAGSAKDYVSQVHVRIRRIKNIYIYMCVCVKDWFFIVQKISDSNIHDAVETAEIEETISLFVQLRASQAGYKSDWEHDKMQWRIVANGKEQDVDVFPDHSSPTMAIILYDIQCHPTFAKFFVKCLPGTNKYTVTDGML